MFPVRCGLLLATVGKICRYLCQLALEATRMEVGQREFQLRLAEVELLGVELEIRSHEGEMKNLFQTFSE